MRAIISITGRSNSGKTTLILRIIEELRKQGYRASVIKHTFHHLETDPEGKDSRRFRESGADTVLLTNDTELTLYTRLEEPPLPEELVEKYIGNGSDIVILEGFKSASLPKLEVVGNSEEAPLYESGIMNIRAVISDKKRDTGLPFFKRDDVRGITDFIVDNFIKESPLHSS
jgi:molybdopterin-guanine dinucleotide biosynthesis protein B